MTSPSHANRKPREEYLEVEREKAFRLYHEKRVEILREAAKHIDFDKFGWVTEVSRHIYMPAQKVRRWMAKFTPDLLENAFERRRCQPSSDED